MKQYFCLFLIMLVLTLFSGCKKDVVDFTQELPIDEIKPGAISELLEDNSDSIHEEEINDNDAIIQKEAYYAVFENLYTTDSGLNADSKYIVIDLTKVILADTEPLIELMQDFCNENGYILMLDTLEGLKETGYIVDLYFSDGFIIGFEDLLLVT